MRTEGNAAAQLEKARSASDAESFRNIGYSMKIAISVTMSATQMKDGRKVPATC
jgi:hypothetical protein